VTFQIMNQITRHTFLLAWLVLAGSAVLPTIMAAEDAALVLYVDAIRGDDRNCGQSPQAALRTLSAAQAAMDKVPDGEKVVLLLARGPSGARLTSTRDRGVHRATRPSPSDGRD